MNFFSSRIECVFAFDLNALIISFSSLRLKTDISWSTVLCCACMPLFFSKIRTYISLKSIVFSFLFHNLMSTMKRRPILSSWNILSRILLRFCHHVSVLIIFFHFQYFCQYLLFGPQWCRLACTYLGRFSVKVFENKKLGGCLRSWNDQ